MSVDIIKVKQLDLEMIEPSTANIYKPEIGGNKIVVIGKPGTGKSNLIKHLLYSKKHIIPVAIVFSGTEESNHFYSEFIPSTFVFNNYDEESIQKYLKRQKLSREHLKNPWSCLVVDDCTDESKVFTKPLQQRLFKNGRHYNQLYILSLQYAIDIRPNLRNNVDGTFILRETNIKMREKIYENYAGIIPSFDLFCKLLDEIAQDYTALYIHNRSISNNWQDCVFYFKAACPLNFKFGCDEFWEFHEARYNTEYKDPI